MTPVNKQAPPTIAPHATLTILGTTDVHGHVMPFDYITRTTNASLGIVHTAEIIEDIRTKRDNVLLFDDGDFLQGTPLSELALEDPRQPLAENPVIQALNLLDYDAVALGNHDFLLKEVAPSSVPNVLKAPLLCANLCGPDGVTPLIQPWVILERDIVTASGLSHPIQIGVIGFAPENLESWETTRLPEQTSLRTVISAATAEIPRMKSAGADIIIALCHEGLEEAFASPETPSTPMKLAAIDGIDAIFAGHVHQLFPIGNRSANGVDSTNGTILGKPAAMPGHLGKHLGVITLELDRGADGTWRIVSGNACLINQTSSPTRSRTAQKILDTTQKAHEKTLSALDEIVTQTRFRMHSYLSLVAPDIPLQIVADAQRDHARSLLQSRPDLRELPLLSMVTPYRAGGLGGAENYIDFPSGQLTRSNIWELYQYPNSLSILEATADQIKACLARSACIFCAAPASGDDFPLHDDSVPSYHFDVIDGLEYEIDLVGAKLAQINFNGRPVDEVQRFLVVTNSFRAGALIRAGMKAHLHDKTLIRTIIEQALRSGRVTPGQLPRATWRLIAPPGHKRVFRSSTPAKIGPAKLDGVRIDPLSLESDGFWRYRLIFD